MRPAVPLRRPLLEMGKSRTTHQEELVAAVAAAAVAVERGCSDEVAVIVAEGQS